MYTFKIDTKANVSWNQNLLKSSDANFFQSLEYLSSDSKEFFPVFISVFGVNGDVVGQLGITIIKSTMLYSIIPFSSILNLFTKITKRGIWLYGPIIHSKNEKDRIEILQNIIKANDIICQEHDLVVLEGYTPPYGPSLNDNHKQQFSKHGYSIKNAVTFVADMTKSIDEIWNTVSKKARGDVIRAKRRNIIVKELQNYDELKEYLILHSVWAKTKGLKITDPLRDIEKLWRNHNSGVEKFFLAYKDDQLISALRVACFNGIAYTHFVVSSYSESTNLGGTLLSWSALEWAKNNGIRIYDFSGAAISDDYGPQDEALMFYKKKWGGDERIHYNLIKVSKKYHYSLYRFLFGIIRSYHNFKGKIHKSSIHEQDKDE